MPMHETSAPSYASASSRTEIRWLPPSRRLRALSVLSTLLALLAVGLSHAPARAASSWRGKLTVMPQSDLIDAGATIAVELNCDSRGKPNPDAVAGRDAQFFLLPYRWNLFAQADWIPLKAKRSGDRTFEVAFPSAPGGYYFLLATMRTDPGFFPRSPDQALSDKNHDELTRMIPVAIRNPGATPKAMVHTEFARCVFCPGENFRVFASGRTAGAVTITAAPKGWTGEPVVLAQGALRPAGGKASTVAFDIPAATSAALAPGMYDMVCALDGQETDRYPIQIIQAEPTGGAARWFHGLPFGYSGGVNSRYTTPGRLRGERGWVENTAKRAHNCNLFIGLMGGGGHPPVGPDQRLPHADNADLPPAAAYFRPMHGHAVYQYLMSRGIALGAMFGGTEIGSENYTAIPTVFQDQIDYCARHYLNGALAISYLPHFVGAYTDAYSRPDWHGAFTKGGNLPGGEVNRIREELHKRACEYAGIGAPFHPGYDFGSDRRHVMDPDDADGTNADKGEEKAFRNYLKEVIEKEFGGDESKLKKADEATKMRYWKAAWKAAGRSPAPMPRKRYRFPRPDTDRAPDMKGYKYTQYIQRGFERYYTGVTGTLEEQLPAVFTVHNKNRENHRQPAVYAWGDWSRSPSVAADFCKGATVIAVSAWNLDAEPQAYLLSTFTHRSLLEDGQPVWRTAAFHFNGSQSRFLRDAIYLTGRNVTPFYESPQSATWAHQGADQSSYAAKDRLGAVTEFLTCYESLFDQLKPVKEVAYYLHPGWASENVYSYVTAFPATLMSGHQIHVVTPRDMERGALKDYKVVFAAGLPFAPDYTVEKEAFRAFVDGGGTILSSLCYNDRLLQARQEQGKDLKEFNLLKREVPVLNDEGEPVIDKRSKKPRMKDVWVKADDPNTEATNEDCAKAVKAVVWKDFPEAQVIPIRFTWHWAYVNEEGKRESYGKKAHWTGYHMWANASGAALAYHKYVQAVLDRYNDPLVVKNEPEVFACVQQPRDEAAQGRYLFLSNFTIPKEKEWTNPRVPYFFWPTYAAPLNVELKIKEAGIGAVYDLMTGQRVETTTADERVVFHANLGSLEGRVFALLPAAIGGATLSAPASVPAGQAVQATFQYKDEGGAVMPIIGSTRLRLTDANGALLTELNRAVGVDGKLPPIPVPATAKGPLKLAVTDTISGQHAVAEIAVGGEVAPATPSDPVTVFRGDAIHRFLQANKGRIRIVVDSGRMKTVRKNDPAEQAAIEAKKKAWQDAEKKKAEEAKKNKKKYRKGKEPKWPKPKQIYVQELQEPNPALATAKAWAGKLAQALNGAGVPAKVVESKDAVTGGLSGHLWVGGASVPRMRIPGPVILVGSPTGSEFLRDIERSHLAGRSLGPDNTGGDRGVVAYIPRAFSPESDTVVLAAEDEAGAAKAIAKLAAIASSDPGADPHYVARENVRFQWLPDDVARYKRSRKVLPPASPLQTAGGGQAVEATKGDWTGFEDLLGPHIYELDASENGVAVSLSTLAKPVALVTPDGQVKMVAGGGEDVWGRDIAVSADGQTLTVGYGLSAKVKAYKADGSLLWESVTGVVHKEDNLKWDTFKDSERFLNITPDHKTLIVAQGRDGVAARDAATGKPLWTRTTFTNPERPRGPAARQMPVSPDGKFAVVYFDEKTGEEPVTRRGKPVLDENGKPKMDIKTKGYTEVVRVADGKTVWRADSDISGWELYATLGPEAAWTITSGRGSTFALRDDKGVTLRIFKPDQLPRQAGANRGQIPPIYLAGMKKDRLVITKPETKAIYLMNLDIGTAAERAAANQAAEENKAAARTLKEKLNDRKEYKKFNGKYVDDFLATIPGPEKAKKVIGDKMKKLPGELRARRRRDFRFLENEYGLFVKLQFEEDKAIFEKACGMSVRTEIPTPDIINEVVIDPAMTTAYAALWDGTVRAYDLESGKEKWVAPVIGGCQLALTGDTLYAGGSRGDLYRIDAASGMIAWRINLTKVSCDVEK